MSKKYAECGYGLVHLIQPGQGEHTICGDAFDADSERTDEEKKHAWKEVSHGPVSCPDCAAVILQCRGVRIKIEEAA